MDKDLTIKAISAYNGNLHNGMTKALEAVVALVLEEAAQVADAHRLPLGDSRAPYKIAAAIRALAEKPVSAEAPADPLQSLRPRGNRPIRATGRVKATPRPS